MPGQKRFALTQDGPIAGREKDPLTRLDRHRRDQPVLRRDAGGGGNTGSVVEIGEVPAIVDGAQQGAVGGHAAVMADLDRPGFWDRSVGTVTAPEAVRLLKGFVFQVVGAGVPLQFRGGGEGVFRQHILNSLAVACGDQALNVFDKPEVECHLSAVLKCGDCYQIY